MSPDAPGLSQTGPEQALQRMLAAILSTEFCGKPKPPHMVRLCTAAAAPGSQSKAETAEPQVLKEICDKAAWKQPQYQYQSQPVTEMQPQSQGVPARHMAHVSLASAVDSPVFAERWAALPAHMQDAMRDGRLSDVCSTQDGARQAAATSMLSVLVPGYQAP